MTLVSVKMLMVLESNVKRQHVDSHVTKKLPGWGSEAQSLTVLRGCAWPQGVFGMLTCQVPTDPKNWSYSLIGCYKPSAPGKMGQIL